MLWTRAKSILIAVLLLVNLFLMGISASVQTQKVRLSDSYLDDIAVQLEVGGVQIDRGALPNRRVFLPQITLSTREMLVPLARTLLGDDTLEPLTEPEGSRFENDTGTVIVRNDGVLLYLPTQSLESLSQLEALLQQAGYGSTDLAADEERGILSLLVDGVPVDGCGLALHDGAAFGRLLLTEQRETVYKNLLDPPNALLRFADEAEKLEQGGQLVTRVETVYLIQQGGRYSTVVLTPAYRITADSGVWLVNAVSGTVEKAADPLDQLRPDVVF